MDMNTSPSETKRLVDAAAAGIAATIAEMIDARVRKLGEAMEQQVAIRTAVPPPPIEAWVDIRDAELFGEFGHRCGPEKKGKKHCKDSGGLATKQ